MIATVSNVTPFPIDRKQDRVCGLLSAPASIVMSDREVIKNLAPQARIT